MRARAAWLLLILIVSAAVSTFFAGCASEGEDVPTAMKAVDDREGITPGERRAGPPPDRAGSDWGGW